MDRWPNNTSTGESSITIWVKFNKIPSIMYDRTSGEDVLCSGDFMMNKDLLKKINSSDEFLEAFKDGKIFKFIEANGFTNIDSVLDSLHYSFGDDFTPDPEERYLDKKGYSLIGEKVAAYWENYIADRMFREYFIKQFELATQYDYVTEIIVDREFWGYEGQEHITYTIDFRGEQLAMFKEKDCFAEDDDLELCEGLISL